VLLPALVGGCGRTQREALGEAVSELEKVVARLEGCGDASSFQEAIPELEASSKKMLDLTAKAQELPEEERKAFTDEYGEKISSLARRYAKQSARAVLVEGFKAKTRELLGNIAEVLKRLSPFHR
jgi:hypothetical protein